MKNASRTNWSAITPSPFPWEKEALDYIQSQFPTHEPYRAWSNFEFVADDGKTDPAMVECEATIDSEQFDPNLREQFTSFFKQALRRNPRERFDNAQQMLEAWYKVFSTATLTTTTTDEGVEPDNSALLAVATLDTTVAELGLGPAVVDALDRINVVKVGDLIHLWGKRLSHMRGVGNKTRKRILSAVKVLRERLGSTTSEEIITVAADDASTESSISRELLSIDILVQQILRAKAKSRNATENTALEALLGLDQRLDHIWPSQADVAQLAGVTRGRISQIQTDALARWSRNPAITALRDQVTHILEQNGGVMSVDELSQSFLTVRGCIAEEPRRSRLGRVVTRAAVETENLRDEPKFVMRRAGTNVLIATDMSLADYAAALGRTADQIAKEDPLVPPLRVVEMLREVPLPPEAEPLSDARMIRLAAAASQSAAVSSRQEDWNVVIAADAAPPQSTDWRNLNRLIDSKVIPQVEQAFIQGDTTVLAYHLNWLERYGQVVMLTRVQQAVQDGRLHGAWLLIPASPQTEMPLLDGAAVPVITNNQWAPIPESWCRNMHRAGDETRRHENTKEMDL